MNEEWPWQCDLKRYCPFCGENCYREKQVVAHIKAKNWWERNKGLEITHFLQTNLINMNNCDYDETKAKINALIEYLGVEFVPEKIDNGAEETINVFVRKKKSEKKK